jgi:hypothetical protein
LSGHSDAEMAPKLAAELNPRMPPQKETSSALLVSEPRIEELRWHATANGGAFGAALHGRIGPRFQTPSLEAPSPAAGGWTPVAPFAAAAALPLTGGVSA